MGRRLALQILAGKDESPRSNLNSYPTHFRCKFEPENKIKLNLWAMERASPKISDANPLSKDELTNLNLSKKSQKKILPFTEPLFFPQHNEGDEVEIFSCDNFNKSKGLIYIPDYNISDIDHYCSELNKRVKPLRCANSNLKKNTTFTPLQLNFKDKEQLRFIEIPVEQ